MSAFNHHFNNQLKINNINEDSFKEYKKIQSSGEFNMLSPEARRLSSLNAKQWYFIISNYKELQEKYPNI